MQIKLTAACFIAKPTAISEWYSLSVLSHVYHSLCSTISLQLNFNLITTTYIVYHKCLKTQWYSVKQDVWRQRETQGETG